MKITEQEIKKAIKVSEKAKQSTVNPADHHYLIGVIDALEWVLGIADNPTEDYREEMK